MSDSERATCDREPEMTHAFVADGDVCSLHRTPVYVAGEVCCVVRDLETVFGGIMVIVGQRPVPDGHVRVQVQRGSAMTQWRYVVMVVPESHLEWLQ